MNPAGFGMPCLGSPQRPCESGAFTLGQTPPLLAITFGGPPLCKQCGQFSLPSQKAKRLREGGSERVACPSAGLTTPAAKRTRHRESVAIWRNHRSLKESLGARWNSLSE